MTDFRDALDEYVNMRGPYLTPMYSQDQAAAARARVEQMYDALRAENDHHAGDASWLRDEVERLRATLARVEALEREWRKYGSYHSYADKLAAALEPPK